MPEVSLGFMTEQESLLQSEDSFLIDDAGADITSTINGDDEPIITPEHKEELKQGFGHKTMYVHIWYSNMTGPGMVGIALQFQQAGWFL
ncbi:hypothetical protein PPL_10151 [Heterostelium album PN500]|uniref:Uncharacterized protein n=1 Tax=Heterostelium pallidum (strain ATCC 26659 / Pp 5 / PN500) TaxID=670386 RepID=D3BQG6_HETP5|nr:hypothetical protein PPL_10151 [Heterostelium album PN500]EFA76386.1 hypothetical protein PPL_10151 [Heterostelium album PN500]|eukprot:XP_020428518.1 hypothetical protein PPL_10151 [Heterostelium album PN500]